MQIILLSLHILVCLLVILVVLIQSGRGAGLQNVFGGGGGDALFSAPSGSSFIRKLTTGLAVSFFITSLGLTYLAARRGMRTVTRGPWTQGTPIPLQPGQIPGVPTTAAPAPAQSPAPQGAAPSTEKR
jgi:preprotein translocase subunit SecG